MKLWSRYILCVLSGPVAAEGVATGSFWHMQIVSESSSHCFLSGRFFFCCIASSISNATHIIVQINIMNFPIRLSRVTALGTGALQLSSPRYLNRYYWTTVVRCKACGQWTTTRREQKKKCIASQQQLIESRSEWESQPRFHSGWRRQP